MSFRKELAISAQSPVGKKDLKMLRKGIAGAFPRLTAAQLDAVLPLSDDWSALKLKGSGTILYQRTGKPPAFFDLEGRDDLWPSLYTLWVLPEMLPSLEIYGPVSRHLLKGADLMLPGVIVPERDGLPRFTPGARLAVRVAGNAFPIAVGSATLSNVDAAAGGMKGKGMLIAHVFRDALWSFGGRTTPNAGFGLEEVGECAEGDSAAALAGVVAGLAETTISAAADDSSDDEAAADGAAAAAGGGGGGGGEAGSAESAAVEQLSALSMDELLLETLLNAACSTLLEPKALPLDVADVYAKHMQLAKPASVSLDAKRSTYKQLTKFFKAMQKSKLLATKEHKSARASGGQCLRVRPARWRVLGQRCQAARASAPMCSRLPPAALALGLPSRPPHPQAAPAPSSSQATSRSSRSTASTRCSKTLRPRGPWRPRRPRRPALAARTHRPTAARARAAAAASSSWSWRR
jgi:translation initiation factor 2D